ncbi:membrane protein insertase YidC [Actinoplanes sp. NPDC051494]|uniref:membrane protein insertase YidC n=1 Tax=Actinoplanes sp. NPDC051494 TaxID=3363907 RepID=UPI0037938D0F
MSSLMGLVYSAISAVLLFWHAAWDRLLGEATAFGTSWSWVLGIIFLVLTVRVLLFPVVVKQVRSQRAMQALQPRMKALQEKHRGDPAALQRETMELYRSENVNPITSLIPMLVQVPVFIGLFHVLRHLRPSITSEHARTLYGWTLGQFDSAAHAELFGAPIAATFRSGAAQLQVLGAQAGTVRAVTLVLIAVMVVTTWLTSRQMILRTGWAQDPQQRMIQRLMLYGIPFSLLISGLIFPLGVIIYWVTQNLFALGQQTWILHAYPPPAPAVQPAGPGLT